MWVYWLLEFWSDMDHISSCSLFLQSMYLIRHHYLKLFWNMYFFVYWILTSISIRVWIWWFRLCHNNAHIKLYVDLFIILGCDDCSTTYSTECPTHKLTLVPDKVVLSRAWSSLPPLLQIFRIGDPNLYPSGTYTF